MQDDKYNSEQAPATFERILITPQMAEQYLATMGSNRKLSTRNTEKLADMMRNGQWVFDGSPIRFNLDDELVDGQHRMWALIEADYSAEFLVVRGVVPEAFATMDTGKPRSFTDILSIEDPELSQIVALAATIQIIYRWEDGRRGSALSSLGGNVSQQVPNGTLLEFFRQNRDRLVEVARKSSTLAHRNRAIPGSAYAVAVWVFEAIDAADSQFFFDRLGDGAGLPEGSPILALRNYLGRALANATGRERLPGDLAVAIMIKAWNAYREGEMIKILSYRRGGASPEAFPTPK